MGCGRCDSFRFFPGRTTALDGRTDGETLSFSCPLSLSRLLAEWLIASRRTRLIQLPSPSLPPSAGRGWAVIRREAGLPESPAKTRDSVFARVSARGRTTEDGGPTYCELRKKEGRKALPRRGRLRERRRSKQTKKKRRLRPRAPRPQSSSRLSNPNNEMSFDERGGLMLHAAVR